MNKKIYLGIFVATMVSGILQSAEQGRGLLSTVFPFIFEESETDKPVSIERKKKLQKRLWHLISHRCNLPAEEKIEKIKRVISQGADINIRHVNGSTPLSYAISEKQTEVACYLIEAGANVNGGDQIPLHVAIVHNEEMAETLMRAGADLNRQNDDQESALHRAVRGRENSLITLFIRNNADVNLHDKNGDTPFELALNHKKIDLAPFIQTFNLDSIEKVEAYYGKKALDLARRYGRIEELEELCNEVSQHLEEVDSKPARNF